jgi:hypothetical protein
MAVGADTQPCKVEREFEVGKLGVGRIARQLIVGNITADREDAGAAGQESWAMARMFEFSSVSGTSRSSVGMMVTFFQLSLAWASFAKIGSGLAAGQRDEGLAAGVECASMMKPTSPETASASSSMLS